MKFIVDVTTIVYIVLLYMDMVFCSRPLKKMKKLENRLSEYLHSQEGKHARNQWVRRESDDEDLLFRIEDMQGDTIPTHVNVDDPEFQKHICCHLGKAMSKRTKSCSAKPYINIVKQHLRQKLISEQTGQHTSVNSSVEKYNCILKHKHSFVKCCHASKSTFKHRLHEGLNKRHSTHKKQ